MVFLCVRCLVFCFTGEERVYVVAGSVEAL